MTQPSRRRSTRDRVVDLGCIVVSALVAAAVAWEADNSGRVTGRALFWALMLAACGCVALWWRRRQPVAVAVLLAPLATATDFLAGAVLVAVYTVAANRRWRVTGAVTALHGLAGAVFSVMRPDPALTAPAANVINIALLMIAVTIGTSVRSRRELVASLRERAARAEMEAALRAEQVRAMERERIAREMHDVLAHRISLVSLHAGALEIRSDLSTEEVARAAATIRASAHEALEDLREILGVLRVGADGTDLRPQPGLADLDDLVAECRSAGSLVELENRLPDGVVPPPSVSRTAYRVVQEGLTNARKHAPGAPVTVGLDRASAGELHVWIRNDLVTRPGPTIPGAHSGLVGLAERVSLAGGRLDAGARRGTDGTVAFHLEAWMPWPI